MAYQSQQHSVCGHCQKPHQLESDYIYTTNCHCPSSAEVVVAVKHAQQDWDKVCPGRGPFKSVAFMGTYDDLQLEQIAKEFPNHAIRTSGDNQTIHKLTRHC